jgi:NAD-dependent dihydropyrimidine dehydrogenase PreA subunit
MNQEAIIICESIYQGNTMRLAKAMAFALNCRVVSAGEALAMDLSQFKVVGLGSGIYFTSHHPLLIEAAERLTPAQQAFVFSTHGAPMRGRYHHAIEKTLKRRGVRLLGGFSTKGYDCTGPFILVGGGNKGRPNERDAQKAARFVRRILPQYAADLSAVPKGHFVHVTEACIACGKCVAVCPMQVFTMQADGSKPEREQDCIHCSLCQQTCSERAIHIHHGFADAIHIAKRHAHRQSLNG